MTRVWSKAVWGATVALWLMTPAPAAAQHGKHKLDKPLSESSQADGPRRIIVRVKPGAKLHVKKRLSQHGSVVAEHGIVDALTAHVHPEDLAALAADPAIESMSLDAPVKAWGAPPSRKGKKDRSSTESATGSTDSSETVSSTYFSGAWDFGSTITTLKDTLGLAGLFSGSSVTVAVIDSGLAPLADFQGRIAGFYDFTFGRNALAVAPYDDYGHGTHVAGLIGSSGASSYKRYAGVAPGVRFLSLKVLDRRGAGRTSDVIRALEFAVANKDRFGIRVVNLSLGHPIYESAATDPLVQAVEGAVRAGLVVVVAAGNSGTSPSTGLPGYGGIASPGNAPSAITVGAADTNGTIHRADDRVAAYSSRGPAWFDGTAKPDILAPGQAMISNAATGCTLSIDYPSLLLQSGSSKYLKLNGSSMATGVVAGLAAVMIEANQWGAYMRWSARQELLPRGQRTSWSAPPRLTPNAVKAMLQYSATVLRDEGGLPYDALTQGTGLVNGVAAATLAFYADTTRATGNFWLTTHLTPETSFGDTAEPWAQSLIWGTRVLSGSSLVEVNQLAWADNIVWGTGEMDNIVWGTINDDGDNIVWGTAVGVVDVVWAGNASWGDNIVWGTAAWADNIVWGTGLLGYFDGDNIVWGTLRGDNIVWGTLSDDNIVWGTNDNKVTILGSSLIGGGL